MNYLFYISAILCGYSYFLYPLMLRLIPVRNVEIAPLAQDGNYPVLSLIITAHNEELRIRDKLDNTMDIDYPRDKLDIIVASDCSSDATDEIVATFGSKDVRLIRSDQRLGKEYAQWCAIRQARGVILVFSDVATFIPPDALRRLVEAFADWRVGAVSSEDRFVGQDDRLVGEGIYVKYEMWLRRLESTRAGLVGLSGSFFAARREICEDWDSQAPSDFNTALNCAKQGFFAITTADVVGVYRDVKDPALEYRRKLRTVIRGMTAVAKHPEVLNPFRLGWFAFEVWSHKILRWGVPWFMLALALTTLALQGQGIVYSLALWAQLIFYLSALAGWLSSRMRENAMIRIVFFFVQTNLALAQAALLFISGRRMGVWEPSKR